MSVLSLPEILPPAPGEEMEDTALPGAMGREAVCMHTQRQGSPFHCHTRFGLGSMLYTRCSNNRKLDDDADEI